LDVPGVDDDIGGVFVFDGVPGVDDDIGGVFVFDGVPGVDDDIGVGGGVGILFCCGLYQPDTLGTPPRLLEPPLPLVPIPPLPSGFGGGNCSILDGLLKPAANGFISSHIPVRSSRIFIFVFILLSEI
jgi:hypothetical protein